MRISHRHKFVFINVPFTGCDFVNDALDAVSDIFGVEDMNSPYYCHMKPQALKNHFSAKGWKWEEYFKFAVVRNPWDRVVYRHFDLQSSDPFDERVEYKLPYVNQQNWWIYDNGIQMVDHVCRYESLQEDFDKVCDKIDIPRKKLKIPSNHGGIHYSDYYDDHLRECVLKSCDADIRRFGYTFEKFDNKSLEIASPKVSPKKDATDDLTKLPDFIIPGFQKCATSALWSNLKKHPQISMPAKKELNYFSNTQLWSRGPDWYKGHFKNDGNLWGDASPNYLEHYDGKFIERMGETIPGAKLIISIRNPVDRAYSAYNHYMQNIKRSKNHMGWLRSGKSFEENVVAEEAIGYERGMVHVGFYSKRLEHLMKYYSDEQILIVIQERMLVDPVKTYSKIYSFLGVDDVKIKYGYSHRRKYKNPIHERCKEMLSEIYAPHNERLFDLLGYEIEEWKVSQ